ncbi:DNA polymerase interacting tpr containing protein of 47kD [Arctopsyche grandis]|uniref:DNA polymerase interacting tpr containing protein of 47kD n=1 Tax=Arctopsyche grandis TaxID=121162 RepID=UPI00406D97D8
MGEPEAIDATAARIALAAQLEAELEEWVENLPHTPYKDGWPQDRWQEEMEKHPFFMKEAPDLTKGDLPPLIEGLAKLKFDPENNTPLELALNYKEDGNFYFKNKNYRLSIFSYSEGIKVKCEDDTLNTALYNNRAQGHYVLENYRSSLKDCQKVLTIDPNHRKSLTRAARCSFKLLEFDLCITYCTQILSFDNSSLAEKLKNESEKIMSVIMANNKRISEVLQRVKDKGIKMYDPTEEEESNIDLFLSSMPEIESPAHLDETRQIIWPITILYPEYQVYDYYQEFHEDRRLVDLINEVLSDTPSWDENLKYKPNTISMYYIGKTIEDLHLVDLNKTLLDVMQERKFMLRQLAPTFIVKLKF